MRHPLNSPLNREVNINTPRIKLLFLTGSLRGKKYMFDCNALHDTQDKLKNADPFKDRQFVIGSQKDANIKLQQLPDDRQLLLTYKSDQGWILTHLHLQSANQKMLKQSVTQH